MPYDGAPNRDDDSLAVLIYKTARDLYALLTGGALPKQYSTVTTPSIASATGDIVTLAAGQKVTIINSGTNPLYVLKGTGASATVWTVPLVAASVNDTGTGGGCEIDDFIGVVSVFGTSPRYTFQKSS